MSRTRRILTASVLAFASLGAAAPAAHACTGIVCDTICDVWNDVFRPGCPIA